MGGLIPDGEMVEGDAVDEEWLNGWNFLAMRKNGI